jgi:SAM-dependent methyltransferase
MQNGTVNKVNDERVNYDAISRVYDWVRAVDLEVIDAFLKGIALDESSSVLDIGCGTGNYTDALHRVTHARVYGLDLSAGMLEKARQKNSQVTFHQGDAEQMPFTAAQFDFVYMTDVIHHVPHISRLFGEIARVLKPGGQACIVTQSYAQIARRPIARFFPGTVAVDQARYPDIPAIVAAAAACGLALQREEVIGAGDPTPIDAEFLTKIRNRGYSMLHLITAEEFRRGLAQVEAQLRQGDLMLPKAGKTLVWLLPRSTRDRAAPLESA